MTYLECCKAAPDLEALEDLKALEALVSHLSDHSGDPEYQERIFELVDQIQNISPYSSNGLALRKLVARFGDAYFFFSRTGNSCFLNDFLKESESIESLLSR